jgi:putative ABC transport system permease protein
MWSSLRSAFRSLTRDRGFTTLAIILIGVTAGATTAVYAVIDAVMLAPMPFADEERTVVMWTRDPGRDTPVVEMALGEVRALHEQSQAFASVGVFGSVNNTLTLENDDGSRERVQMLLIESAAFDAIGIRPAFGRGFNARDEVGRAATTAVISDGFWRSRFGADPNVLGRTLRGVSSGKRPPESLEIIGVMPPGFDFPRDVDVWVPAAPRLRAGANPDGQPGDAAWHLRHMKIFYAVGRLRDGVSVAQASGDMTAALRRVEKDSPHGSPSEAIITPVENFVVGTAKPVLWTMLAGAALMLLLACSSVAGLHLFRSAKQDRAIAVQLALGASRGTLVRQSLLETTMLAIAGAIGGFGVAWVMVRVLVATAPMDVPRLAEASAAAASVVMVLVLLTAITSVLSGMWPAVFIRHVDAGRTLTSGARTAMHPRERLLQRLVVGWQIAVAVVLLSGAALFVRSVQHLDRTPLGFSAPGLVAFELHHSATTPEGTDRFFEEVRARAEALPHVTSTGAVVRRPLSGPVGWDTIPVLKGQEGFGPDAPWRKNPRTNLQAVTAGYFPTIGARVLSGRDFTPQDRDGAQGVVIVSASMAERFWPGRDPIGELVLVASQRTPGGLEKPRWQTVVGVVDDVRYRGITMPRYDVYLPALQSNIGVTQLLVRTTAAPSQVIADIRAIARDVDRLVLFGDIESMSDVVATETAPWRFAMRVLSAFGGLAALLAAVGLVGLVSLSVALRRKELGIRSALGATPGRLRRHVLTEIVWTAVAAATVGTLATLLLGRLLKGLLVDTPPHDPLSIAAAALLTLAAGLIGCLRPAERAARTDPAAVLRD